ncbi:amino acid adenylation domain-containing protein [Natronosporangium hydrolyticum]|uniref:Amino acid adenylation domain-containing protein n=1 Tax=Natronosporangium hydrolyticum TaxID=2811111 RepID=A0A895Y8E2_9ACTN|nr:amino acid adenylation domain-containing protein [Natronosporangium hydrolyticum]QSB13994.1 amino acid adenylation domain-containing protein [Natronosporangium hydrolyticum]
MRQENIEDIYELSQVQEGMLFHSLFSPGSGIYVEQVTLTLEGTLNVDAFCRSWQTIVDRHPILRTTFHWEGVDRALQVVHREVSFGIEILDWRDANPEEQQRRHEELTHRDRMAGFEYDRVPLMRGRLVQFSDQRWQYYWSFSHLLMDGWSFGLVFAELAEIYTAYATGAEPSLAPAQPYRNYLTWWHEQNRSETEQYWREYLAGYQVPDAWEVGTAPSAELSPDEPTHVFLPTPELGELMPELGEFARENGLTLNTVMQGAWMVLLSRYLGRDDVMVGSTGTQRPASLAGAEQIMGPMLATMPVRAKVDDGADLITWLQELQTGMAQSREHADISLPDLRRLADLPGDRPLFEFDLAFENVPVPDLRLADVLITESTYDGRPHFPVTMLVMPGDATPEPRLVYDQTRFTRAAMQRLVEQFTATLVNMARYPELRLGEIDIMPPEQWQLVIDDWNITEPQPAATTLPEVFAAQVAAAPTAVAVVEGKKSVTYTELAHRAYQLAHQLRELGVGRGDRVGLCLQRSADLVVGVLGVLAAGAAYVPLDLGHPPERMRYILGDAGAVALVTHSGAAGQAPTVAGPVVDLDRDAQALAAQPTEAPEFALGPDDLAYLLYTSGTTGRPKGVIVSHGNVTRLLTSVEQRLPLGPDDVVAMCHSYGFDVSVFEMWAALAYGGRLVTVPFEVVRNPDELLDTLAAAKVTVLAQTPSAFRPLIAAAVGAERDDLALKYVVLAGEYLDVGLLDPWFAHYGDEHPWLVNMYGPTESTVYATYHRIRADESAGAVRSNIGRPLPDLRTYLLDARMMPVPPGMTGELFISGPGVAQGYHNQPELTYQHFSYDTYAGEPGHRMYRTGDLARWTDEGELEFLGRADRQVKIRGFRVELGEIESVLREHPHVADAVVQLLEVAGDRRLVAYLVAADGHQPSEPELREWSRGTLPDYMLPSRIMLLDSYPVTANGKIDHAALPGLDGVRPELAGEYIAPRTATEEAVAAVWRELLSIDKVGCQDDFFALGGHSLLATRVVFKLRAEHGVEVPVRTLFERPTLAGLAAAIDDGTTGAAADRRIVRQPRVAQRL